MITLILETYKLLRDRDTFEIQSYMSICNEKDVRTNSLSVVARVATEPKEVETNGKKMTRFKIE